MGSVELDLRSDAVGLPSAHDVQWVAVPGNGLGFRIEGSGFRA